MDSEDEKYEDADSSPVDPAPKNVEPISEKPPPTANGVDDENVNEEKDESTQSLTIDDLAPLSNNQIISSSDQETEEVERLETESEAVLTNVNQPQEGFSPTSSGNEQDPEPPSDLDLLDAEENHSDIADTENPLAVNQSDLGDTANQEIGDTANQEIGDTVNEESSEDMDKPRPSAVCKYRWTKIVDTTSSDVGFYPSYAPNDPILLSWDSKGLAYFSDDVRISCGDYRGSLLIDGRNYPVEEFSVRTYTFEVDLFMKDDVIEDEVSISQSQQQETHFEQQKTSSAVDTFKDIGSPKSNDQSNGSLVEDELNPGPSDPKITSKLEDLVNPLVTVESDTHEMSLSSSLKSDVDIARLNMKRDSPVGDDDVGKFTEPGTSNMSGRDDILERYRSSPERKTPIDGVERSSSRTSDQIRAGLNVIDDVVDLTSTRPLSRGSAGSASASAGLELGEGQRGSRPPSIGAGSTHASLQGSQRQSPAQDAIYGRPSSQTSDRFSPSTNLRNDNPSAAGSARHTPLSDQGAVGGTRTSASPAHSSHSYSQTQTMKEYSSPVVGSTHSSARASPQRDALYGSRERISENGDAGRASSLQGSRPPSHPASRQGSQHSSRAQSLTSITSEQELAQYLDESRRNSSDRAAPSGVTPHPDESLMDPPILRGLERPNSVPNWATQQQMSPDKRSTTPDNRIRVLPTSSEYPAYRNAFVTERMEETFGRSSVASKSGSRASSRTITPVAAENGTRELSSDRVQDLEASVTNLRKLLSNRESEVHSLTAQMEDLKDINRSMKDELDHRGRRHTPVSSTHDSLEFKQLQSEKEILASEVVTLREEIQRLTKGMRGHSSGSGRNSASSGISDYSPNSPVVLQRKIADLEAHIRDLQEVTESTTTNLAKAEERVKRLHEENKDLKSRALNMNDLQTESDPHNLRVELRTLREDIRSLKERNFQLTEENMRLMEGQRVGSKDISSYNISGGGPRLSSSLRSDDGIVKSSGGYTTSSAYRRDFAPAVDRPASSSPGTAPKRSSHEEFAPRDLRQSALNRSYDFDQRMQETSSRLLQQRNTVDSSRLRYQSKDNLSNPKATEAVRIGVLYSDRSRPDGEVAEKVHSDKYSKPLSPHEKTYDDLRDRDTVSYLDKHSSYKPLKSRDSDARNRERYVGDKDDKYRYLNDGGRDRELRVTSPGRHHSSGGAISSKDIFFSLQQKRASQWLQQDNKYISGNLDFQRYQTGSLDDPGDDSDTATDILLAQDGTSKVPARQRRISLGSDGSPSSLSDVEDPSDSLLRRRSKSVDTNRGQDSSRNRQLSTMQRSGSATRPLSSVENMRSTAGLRSVIPAPLVTQHNKGELANKNVSFLSSSLTHGLRPFAPRSPVDIRPEDVVKFSRLGGKLTQGVVKYVGHLPGRGETYLGVELDKDEGKHDGTFEGIRYFKCRANKGVFVAFNKVVMAWAP